MQRHRVGVTQIPSTPGHRALVYERHRIRQQRGPAANAHINAPARGPSQPVGQRCDDRYTAKQAQSRNGFTFRGHLTLAEAAAAISYDRSPKPTAETTSSSISREFPSRIELRASRSGTNCAWGIPGRARTWTDIMPRAAVRGREMVRDFAKTIAAAQAFVARVSASGRGRAL